MQVDMSNNLNVSTTKVKEVTSSDASTYTKTKTEDKFGAVLKKEKQNILSNEKKETNEEISNVNDSSSIPNKKVEGKELTGKVDVSSEESSKELVIKVDERIETLSKDDILSYLAAIVELINKLALSQTNTEQINVNVDESTLNTEILSVLTSESMINELAADNSEINQLISAKTVNMPELNVNNPSNMDQEEAIKVINNILSILENGDDNKLLNKENLTGIQGLLNELGVKLDEEVGTKEIKAYDILKELVKSSKTVTNTLIVTKTEKEILQNNIVDKGLAVKEETPISKNVELAANEINYVKANLTDKNLTDSGKESNENSSSTLKHEISKEEKLLSSILQDGDEKVDSKFAAIVDRLGTKMNTQISAEPKVINKDSIAVDVVKSVKFMATNGMKEMIVKINPDNLGEITIKVIEEGGIMKTNIKASSKETYSLLSQQLGDIKKHLGEQNIKIQEVNISIYEEDATFYKDGQFSSNSSKDESNNRQNNGAKFNGEFAEEELSVDEGLYEESNINMLA